ncbi:MAG: DDE-type integrase/transposase/recombinase [Planctomycetota bacterium]|jgi:transposase InsO family protein
MSQDTIEPGAESPDDGRTEPDGMQFELLSKLPLMPPLRSSRSYAREEESAPPPRITARDKMTILFLWAKSGLPATQFAPLIGKTAATIRAWRRRFLEDGPAGLEEKKREAPKGSRLPLPTRQAILLLKEEFPDYGVRRIHDMLLRSEGFTASPSAIARLLREEGYVSRDVPTKRHPDKVRRFERAKPNQLWQTDIFTFVLKRQGTRLYLIAFLDDCSRFLVGHGLFTTCSGPLVKEVFLKAVTNFGLPEEVLTDQGPQYHSWRGKSAFRKLLDLRGVKQVVARARHPQTLGKIERYWGTLWRECLQDAVFTGLDEARERVSHFVDFYNFRRTHQGIEGMVPADRFFEAAPEVKAALEKRVAANAEAIAKSGAPKEPFYLTGKVGDEPVSLHAEGEKMILTKGDGVRREVTLTAPEIPDGEDGPEGDRPGEEE